MSSGMGTQDTQRAHREGRAPKSKGKQKAMLLRSMQARLERAAVARDADELQRLLRRLADSGRSLANDVGGGGGALYSAAAATHPSRS